MSTQRSALGEELAWAESDVSHLRYALHNAGGFTVVVPRDYLDNYAPIVCRLCDCFLSTSEDRDSVVQHSVCSSCYMRWIQGNPAWTSDWVPPRDTFKEYIIERQNRPVTFWRKVNKKKV